MRDHTPLPWSIRESDYCDKDVVSLGLMAGKVWLGELCEGSEDPDKRSRGWLPIAELRANARLIVASVNSHAALLAAFRKLLSFAEAAVEAGCDDPATAASALQNHHALVEARAAIALAEKETP